MSVLRNPWFWLAVVLFAGHQLLERVMDVDTGLLDSYLDPFCAAPILLGFWLFERRQVFKVARLSWFETAVATLVLAIVFEEVFPRLEEDFRKDVVDYLFYALGGAYFYFLINRP